MTKKELEDLVSAVKSPPLDRKETRKLFGHNSNLEHQQNNPVAQQVQQPVAQQVQQPVAQQVQQPVAQQVQQPVAQQVKQPVAQQVAQSLWVAQNKPNVVAQNKPNVVAQNKPNVVAQNKPNVVAQNKPKSKNTRIKDSQELEVDQYVNKLKDEIFQIVGVDKRKIFVREIGWGVIKENRGRKCYLFGAKKIGGRKYKLYIGNATS